MRRSIRLGLAVAFATALAVPGGARAATGPPADYIGMRDDLSQPVFPQTVREAFRVPVAHDGTEIYVEVVRPDPAAYGDVRAPVIMEISPYHGPAGDRSGTRIFPDPRDPDGRLLGLTGYFAPRGYAVVMVDLRGTGRSGGCLDHLGPRDAKDMKEIVEWSAHPDRPWNGGSWGRVGITGHSYVGSTPSIAAAQRPRGLVTIAPSAGLASMYDHQFQLGVPYNLQWAGPMFGYEQIALERYRGDYPLSPGNASGVGCGLPNSSLTAGPGQVTGAYELWHAMRDWRAAASDVDIPVFIIHGVNDDAARIPAAEWFFGRRFGRPGDKVWIGQWTHGSGSHVNRRYEQWQYALHAWFDHHLMRRNIETGPSVEAFLNEDPYLREGLVLTANAWARPAAYLTLYPDASNGKLGLEPPAAAASASFTPLGGMGSVEFASEAFTEDAVLLGLPRFQLDASVTGEAVHVVTTLWRENVLGDREPMNTCAIQPQLRFNPATPAPVVPGEAMTLRPQCFTMAHHVFAGYRVILEVTTTSDHHVPTLATDARITVHTGPGRTAYELPRVLAPALYPDVRLEEP